MIPPIVIAFSGALDAVDEMMSQQISFIGTTPFSFAAIIGVQDSVNPRPTLIFAQPSYWGDTVLLISAQSDVTQLGVVSMQLAPSPTTGRLVPRNFTGQAINLTSCPNTTSGTTLQDCVPIDIAMNDTITAMNVPVLAKLTVTIGYTQERISGGKPVCRYEFLSYKLWRTAVICCEIMWCVVAVYCAV